LNKEKTFNLKNIDIDWKEYGVFIGFIFIVIVVSIASPAFLTFRNILNLLRQSSIIGVIAAGMTFVIISGNFDISVGAIAALSGAVALQLLLSGWFLPFAILAGLIVGAIIGLLNGILVAKFNISSLIATLAMITIVRGIILLLTGGYPISGLTTYFRLIGNGYLFGIPVPVIIFLLMIIIGQVILTKTRFGRYVYSVGGNEEASKLSGINVDFYKISVFVISGLMAALAGIILASRLETATPMAGDGYELDAIASVVIGGTSVTGGEGGALKTVIGVLLMGVINNSFNLLGINVYFQYIFKGVIILAAVGFDSYNKKRLTT